MRIFLHTKNGPVSFLLVLALLFIAPDSFAQQAFPKPKGLINDFANVIPPSYEQQLQRITAELLNKTGTPVVVVTMPDLGGEDYNEYANRLYETWGIGKKGEDKGVLILVAIKERKMRIEVGYGLEGILPDGLAGEIRDRYMIPYLKQNKFGEGVLNGVSAVSQIIAKDAGVKLTGQVPVKAPKKRRSRLSFVPILLIFLFFIFVGRRRGGSWIFFLPLLMGGGGPRYGSGGFGCGFGGFIGGFGGFGGGMSGGGGAGGGF